MSQTNRILFIKAHLLKSIRLVWDIRQYPIGLVKGVWYEDITVSNNTEQAQFKGKVMGSYQMCLTNPKGTCQMP